MRNGMIRNVVFDMGNVILKFDPAYFITRQGISDENDREILMREVFRSKEWVMMDWGLLTEDTAEPTIKMRIPERLYHAAEQLLHNWHQPNMILLGMEQLIRRLKRSGYGIYLLSNASAMQHEYWPKIEVSRLFDGELISCDVHMIKPMPGIYKYFTEHFGLVPEECVFIDDSPANVVGAEFCGWHGIVFNGDASDVEKQLTALGVKTDVNYKEH